MIRFSKGLSYNEMSGEGGICLPGCHEIRNGWGLLLNQRQAERLTEWGATLTFNMLLPAPSFQFPCHDDNPIFSLWRMI